MAHTLVNNKTHVDAPNFSDATCKEGLLQVPTRPEESELLLTSQVTHANFILAVYSRGFSATLPELQEYSCCLPQ